MKRITRGEQVEIEDPQKGNLSRFLTSQNPKVRNHVAAMLGLKISGIVYKQLEFYVEEIHDLEKKKKRTRTSFRITLIKEEIKLKILFTETGAETEVFFYYLFAKESLPYIEQASSLKLLLPKIKSIFDKEIDIAALKQKITKRLLKEVNNARTSRQA